MQRVDRREALRYMGVRGAPDADTLARLEAAAELAERECPPRYVLRVCDLVQSDEGIALAGTAVILSGKTAEEMLRECTQAALLVCTLGASFERHMARLRNLTDALCLDACAGALVEAGCDAAEQELKALLPEMYLTDRFSPGYGDLPLTIQPDILAATDSYRRLGVTVTESCMLVPQKTVTAFVGLSNRPQRARIRGCAHCVLRDQCEYRKTGDLCRR